MAIFSTNIGTFAPAITKQQSDRSEVVSKSGRVLYKIDLYHNKLNEYEHIKWCRRNLGARGDSWDFWLADNMLYIEVWGDKAKFTYEMWKN